MIKQEWILAEFFGFFLVLSRTIGLFAFMPFLAQLEISPRFRFLAALSFSYMATLLLDVQVPSSMGYTMFAVYAIKEFFIGFFISLLTRSLVSILDITGHIISTLMGISSVSIINPNMQGSTAISFLLTLFGIMMILSLDLHHYIFQGFLQSYSKFPIMEMVSASQITESYIQLFSRVFWFGLQLSFPFLIFFMILQLSMGIMNRIIPQMQIFFVSMPFQIWMGFLILLLTVITILTYFANIFKDELASLFPI